MLKKLNWYHVAVIIALPIFLMLVNPNWIFNPNITDDHIYMGYQTALPKYIGWYPADDSYFVERMSWILPGYVVRQIFSPMLSNFIIHLSVYYLAIFSVYGILNRLYTAKVALIIALIFGQYPLIMRSAGWDYFDGYTMALLALSIYWLTQATGSRRVNIYVFMAGVAFGMAVVANVFNSTYGLALAVYYLLLIRWRAPIRQFITTGVVAFLGTAVTVGALSLIYYLITQRIMFENSFRYLNVFDRSFSYFYYTTYARFTYPHWHFLMVAVGLMVVFRPLIWKRGYGIPTNITDMTYRKSLRAVFGLYVVAYAVLMFPYFRGFIMFYFSFYCTNVAMIAFLLLGAVFAPYIAKYTPESFKYAVISAFFVPSLPLILFSLAPETFAVTNYELLYIGGFLCAVIAFFPKRSLYGLLGFAMFAGVMLNHSRAYQSHIYPPHLDVYVADRYRLQGLYEKVTHIMSIINDRYTDFGQDKFLFYYDRADFHARVYNSVAAIYLWSWPRVLFTEDLMTYIDKTEELIVFTSGNSPEAFLAHLRQQIPPFSIIEAHRIQDNQGDIHMLFVKVEQD